MEKQKLRHDLKGSIRRLSFIFKELDEDGDILSKEEKMKMVNAFDENLKNIARMWDSYKK